MNLKVTNFTKMSFDDLHKLETVAQQVKVEKNELCLELDHIGFIRAFEVISKYQNETTRKNMIVH